MTLLFSSVAVAAQDWLSSCSALVGYRLGLFLAHGPWQPDTAWVRRKALWKSFKIDEKRYLDRATEELFRSNDGIRYAGILGLETRDLPLVVDFARSHQSAFGFLMRSQPFSEDLTSKLFVAAFPLRKGLPDVRVDWLSLVQAIPSESVLIRASGSFDERTANLSFIMNSDMLPT
jgi:hypothetical protein